MEELKETRPSAAQTERLTRVLRDLVSLVAGGLQVDDANLRRLLRGVGLDGEAWALAELRIWLRLLGQAHAAQNAQASQAARYALMARGVREAPAMLAVDMLLPDSQAGSTLSGATEPGTGTVNGASSDATVGDVEVPVISSAELRIEPITLDFGRVRVGQPAERMMVVSGGPARIEVEHPALSVSRPSVGAGPVSVTVRLVMASPTYLHARLRVMAESGAICEVAVTADAAPVEPTIHQSPPFQAPPSHQPFGLGDQPAPASAIGPDGGSSQAPSGMSPGWHQPVPKVDSTVSPRPVVALLVVAVLLLIVGGAALIVAGTASSLFAPAPTSVGTGPVGPAVTAAASVAPAVASSSPPVAAAPVTPLGPVAAAPPSAAPALPPVTPAERLQEAEAAANAGDFARALAILTELGQSAPGTPGLDERLYQTRLRYGHTLLQHGEHDASYGQYEEILRTRPGDRAAEDGKKQVLLIKNWDRQEANWASNPEEAIRALEDILILDASYRDARRKLYAQLISKADRQAQVGDRDAELATLKRAHEVFPDGPEAIARLNPPQAAQPSQPSRSSEPAGPVAVGPPTLGATSFSPRSVAPGSVLTLTYQIENPGPTSQSLVLGASIGPPGGGWLDDSSNDARVTAPPGRSSHSRQFRVPSNASGGVYRVWHSLLDESLKKSLGQNIESGLTVAGGQTSAPSSAGSPADVARRHYEAIGARDFQTAWSLLSRRVRGNLNYTSWVDGYATTRSVQVSTSTVTQSGGNATVAVSLVAMDVQGGGLITKRFEGTWDVVLEDGQWRLDRASIRQVG